MVNIVLSYGIIYARIGKLVSKFNGIHGLESWHPRRPRWYGRGHVMIQMVFATNSGESEHRLSKEAISTYLRNIEKIHLSFYLSIVISWLNRYKNTPPKCWCWHLYFSPFLKGHKHGVSSIFIQSHMARQAIKGVEEAFENDVKLYKICILKYYKILMY